MSNQLVNAVQAVEDAKSELHSAIRSAVESGQRVTEVAEATGYSRQRIYQIVGPKNSKSKDEERLAELDAQWESLVDQIAETDKPPAEWIARETAKRNGRRGIESRRGLPPRPTVLAEVRVFAERKLLETLRKYPEDPRTVGLRADILEAETIRQRLEASYDRSVGL